MLVRQLLRGAHQAVARITDHDIDPAERGPGAIDYATGRGWGYRKSGGTTPCTAKLLTIRHPDGALMLLNCYLSFPSAKVARDCLINSANSRL
jgi:hypothetical protein